ncbi:MAG: FAD-binding protein [Chloroflexi bacterium]|nr:FAD-binding protein [Chloroflexota bacterium]
MQRKSESVRAMSGEVLVIGAGMAGLVASLEAVAAGSRVTVIDKLRSMAEEKVVPVLPGGPGNDTAKSGGAGLGRFESQAPVEQQLEEHLERSWGQADPDLIRAYLERIVDDCRWLRDELRAPYVSATRIRGMGPGLCRFLIKEVSKRKVTLHFETRATELITDHRNAVVGAKASGPRGETEFYGGAVVLATGGFQGNQEMLVKYAGPEMAYGTVLTGCPTNTGDGHIMAVKLGAQMINVSACHVRTMDALHARGPSRAMENIYPRGIYLNMECRRFLDEGTADSDTIANAIVYQPGHKAALVFDEATRAAFPDEWKKYPNKEKTIQLARSLEHLAEKIGVDPRTFTATIKQFNLAVAQGEAHLLPVPKTRHATKIERPPFYAFYPVLPGLNHPLGGLKINAKCQVLNQDNGPIAGLYAAGVIANWAFGKQYRLGDVISFKGSYHAPMASGLATALTFGRIAGRNAALEALSRSAPS